MNLVLDVGNSQIYGGVYEVDELRLTFRKGSGGSASSDELGLFLRSVLRENGIPHDAVKQIAVCTVVPELVHSLRNCARKYFGVTPFLLEAGVRTGLRILYRNPLEVGADRIATAVGATKLFPGRNAIVIDFGTATTFDAVTGSKDYLGGLILPGFRLSMEALEEKTAKLPKVEIVKPRSLVGRSTVESIQSGLYYGKLGAVRGIADSIQREHFGGSPAVVIGTGGFSRLFENEGVFDALVPDLVLTGLQHVLEMNV